MNLDDVSGALIAKCLGISRRQHSNLVKSSVLPGPNAARKYALAPSIKAYIAHKTGAAGTLAEEKLKLTTEQRRKLELANGVRARQLVLLSDVEFMFQELAVMYVGALQALPSRVASAGAGMGAAELRAVAMDEVRAVREQLAEAIIQRSNELSGGAA